MPTPQTYEVEYIQKKLIVDLKKGDVVEPVWLWEPRRIVKSNDNGTLIFENADPVEHAKWPSQEKFSVVKIRKTKTPPWV